MLALTSCKLVVVGDFLALVIVLRFCLGFGAMKRS